MIKNETFVLKLKRIHSTNYNLNNTLPKEKLKEKYNEWIYDLSQIINNRLYRQTLKEIESNKYKFILLKDELWKYRLIKAKAILKIIKIKIKKHLKEIALENSKQNFALKFWFNQIYLTLEELILEFRYDLNNQINYESKEILEPIGTIIEYHFEFFYYLCIFYLKTNDIASLITVLYIVEKFLIYIPFFNKGKILYFLENIILIKIKILLENCEYLAAFEKIKILSNLCFREILLIFDYDTPININNFTKIYNNHKKSQDKKIIGFCKIIQKIVLAFYLRGVILEQLGYFKPSIHSYNNCYWFANTFLYDYDRELYRIIKTIRTKYIMFKEIFYDIHNLIKRKKFYEKNSEINSNFIIKNYGNNSCGVYQNHNSKKTKSNRFNTNIPIIRNTKKIKNSSTKLINKKEKLETLMKDIGNNLYKEEKNRNSSIFKRFTINSFVLSTVDMIDNLLSNPFSYILKKMKKVEITKPQEEIKDLINRTINHKRRTEFKKELDKMKEKMKKEQHKKYYLRTNSCDNIRIYKNNSCFNLKKKNKPNLEISKNEETEREKSSFMDTKNNILKEEINLFNNRIKSKLNTNKTIQKKNNNNKYKKDMKNISKYPVNKGIFSRSFLSKRIFLDSFYEKELNFQKKLLKLKGNVKDKISNKFIQQKAINMAEQEFKILKNSAEDKSKKKNLINLLKNGKDFRKLGSINYKKKAIKNNKQSSLLNLKKYMLMNNINNNIVEYDPLNISKFNEEKSKILNVECAELEQLQKNITSQRKILMHKGIKKNLNRSKF